MKRQNVKDTCEQIIKYLSKDGLTIQVIDKDLKKAIKWFRGIDPRTVKTWTNALLEFEYLIPVSPKVYRINHFLVPEIFKIVKNKPQSKLQ